jgi:hypothetical protein
MRNNKAETVCNTDVAATKDKQTIQRDGNGVPAPAGTATVRPWTSDFLLPSIRFREPNAPEDEKYIPGHSAG